MIALLQRVSEAAVSVAGRETARIASGLLMFAGFARGDDEAVCDRMLDRVLQLRMFADADGRMNLNLSQAHGALLLVPQFTLTADTRRGRRPSFGAAAPPDAGAQLFAYLVRRAVAVCGDAQSGEFGAHMRVSLVNDGPATFILEEPARQPA